MEKSIIKVTENEMLEILLSVDKPTFTNIKSRISQKMKKTDNPYFEKVFKTSVGNYFIGGSYEDMVNKRMEKEGIEPTFKSKECSVGGHVEGAKCILHNQNLGKHYLQYFIFETSNIKSTYEFEGNEIEKQLFESYIAKKSETSRQPQENKHRPQTFMLSSILEISLNGNRYVIER
jgi:hypothetical protein